MKHSILSIALGLFCAGSPLLAQNLAGDMALSKVLIEGENWELLASGYEFTDSACSDAAGNFYFTDVARGNAILRIAPDKSLSTLLTNTPRISGLKFAPDGRLIACTQAPRKQIVAFELPGGKMTVLADDVQPNDLVVSREGHIYFTETGLSQVSWIPPQGGVRAADKGIYRPNGLTLSPDEGTLVVADFGGTNLWAFRVETNGSLTARAPYMTVRGPLAKPDVASSDGMTTDEAGRYYVATAVGLQMFDATGRLGGVIAKPQDKFLSNVAFAGPGRAHLYVTCADKIFRRKTSTQGAPLAWTGQVPATANKP